MSLVSMPLFPLGTVLFPGGVLPLQIFEVRYLDLIRQCLRDSTPFGVIYIEKGTEVRKPDQSLQLATVGTLARIVCADAPSPSLLKIRTVGTQRFRLESATQKINGLWMGEIELLEEEPDIEIPDYLQTCADRLGDVVRSLDSQNIDPARMPFHPPYKLTDCAWVANRWCELLPITPTQRQQMLALDSPLIRLELVSDHLAEHKLV